MGNMTRERDTIKTVGCVTVMFSNFSTQPLKDSCHGIALWVIHTKFALLSFSATGYIRIKVAFFCFMQ